MSRSRDATKLSLRMTHAIPARYGSPSVEIIVRTCAGVNVRERGLVPRAASRALRDGLRRIHLTSFWYAAEGVMSGE